MQTKLKTKKKANLVTKMESSGPSRAKLRRIVKRSRPPQSWYQQNDKPFGSTKK